MKYKYTPNCFIVDYDKGKNMFKFDDKGEFKTDDPKLIEWIRKNKPFLKPVEEDTGGDAQAPCYSCPYCDFTAKNKGGLTSHIRGKHPKEGD